MNDAGLTDYSLHISIFSIYKISYSHLINNNRVQMLCINGCLHHFIKYDRKMGKITWPRSMVRLTSLYLTPRESGGDCHQRL